MKKLINLVANALLILMGQIMAQDYQDNRIIIFVNDINKDHSLIVENGHEAEVVTVEFGRFDQKLVRDLDKSLLACIVQNNITNKSEIVCSYGDLEKYIENPSAKNRGRNIKVILKKGIFYGYRFSVDYFGTSNEESRSISSTLSQRLGLTEDQINNPDVRVALFVLGFKKLNQDYDIYEVLDEIYYDISERAVDMLEKIIEQQQILDENRDQIGESKYLSISQELSEMSYLIQKSQDLLLDQYEYPEKYTEEQKNEARKILDVTSDTPFESMRTAYKKLALKWHPDKWLNRSEEEKNIASKKMDEISEAAEILGLK